MADFRKYEEFVRLKENITLFLKYYNTNNWVISISPTQDVVSVKPIHSGDYSNLFLFNAASKVLLMSSTILDKDSFCRHNGIKLDDVEFLSIEYTRQKIFFVSDNLDQQFHGLLALAFHHLPLHRDTKSHCR
jgi:hypothetical protein